MSSRPDRAPPPRRASAPRARLCLEQLEDRSLPSSTLPAPDGIQLDPTRYDPGYVIAHVAGAGAATTAASPVPAALPAGAEDLGAGLFLVPVPTGMTVTAAVDLYAARPGIDYVTPDYTVTASALPNDPNFGSLWGLNNTGQSGGTTGADIGAARAWGVTTGTGKTTVAVIDTGIDYDSPDLYLNVWINQQAIPAAVRAKLVDVDGDGVIDFRDLNDPRNQGAGKITDVNGDGRIDAGDILAPVSQGGWSTGPADDLIGWNYAGNNNDPSDSEGHGTHVAGIIGAVGNNGVGVAGVDWNVRIMPLKFIGPDGTGSLGDAIKALNYAVAHGARLANNSYGGADAYQPMADAIAAARSAGLVVVAAAGNDGANNDVTPSYPGNYGLDNVLSVAATDRNDRLASFSNYGARTVALAAPGVSILSTLPGGTYGYYSGTSMATAYVTGALALVWDAHPDWDYRQVIAQVLGTADPLPSLAGKVSTGGRLDVGKALTETVSYTPAVTPTPSAPATPAGDSGGTAAAEAQKNLINQLVIANLMRAFAGPFPPGSGVLGAAVTGLTDLNGDGYPDLSGVFVLQGARGQVVVIRLTFDGLSPGGALIGQPSVTVESA